MQAPLRRRRSASLAKFPSIRVCTGPKMVRTSFLQTPQSELHSACGKISEIMPFLRLADCDPDPFGRSRHINVVDLVLAVQPLDDCIDHGRTGADRAGLARALDAERVGRARHVVGFEME